MANGSSAAQLTEVTFEHLKLSPFESAVTKEIYVLKRINEHGYLRYTGVIPDEIKDEYITTANFGTMITLTQNKEGKSEVLFDGILTNIKIYALAQVYYIEVEAHTNTFLMDIQLRSRSFQDITMSYKTLVQKITAEYPNSDVLYTIDNNPALAGFVLQYKETDWQFLKRMASHFHQGLYPAFNNRTSYFFGPPKIDSEQQLDNDVYYVSKNLTSYKLLSQNYIPEVTDLDFVEYEIETYKLVDLGVKVKFNQIDFYVKKVELLVEKGVLKHRYTICSKKGLQQIYFENDKNRGTSLVGQVIAIQRDTVKVHISEIDEKQDVGKAYWFAYQAMYASEDGSGWYCMPEKGDSVRIMLPNSNEKEAYAASSVSKYQQQQGEDEDRMADPNIRWLRNPQGMAVVLKPNCIVITSNGAGTIVIQDDGDITIYGKKEVTVKSEDLINIQSKKSIYFQAAEEIDLKCAKGSNINMSKEGNITISGQEVYTN